MSGQGLYVDGVTVTFDGFRALNNLSLLVEPGELRAVIGPNGAGKTTMMDVITGKTRPDTGILRFAARDLTKLDEAAIATLGIGRKFQKPTVFDALTVFENLELALKAPRGPLACLRWVLSGEARARIEATMEQIGLAARCQDLAGLLSHASEITYFLAPYINSYKRFMAGTFAPTKAIWSKDNRTAGYRLCGDGTKGIRVECRVGGSDLNPYLAMAALLAAGIDGIEKKMELEPAFTGDAYGAQGVREIPRTLRAATETLKDSAMLRAAFGDDVVDHYVRAAEWEQEEYDRRITDWEVARGFERA